MRRLSLNRFGASQKERPKYPEKSLSSTYGSPQPTATSSQRNTSGRGGLETAGPGCYDAVAIARTAGFRMLVMSPHPSCGDSARSRPKKSRQNIPKKRCRTTIAEPVGENLAELPFIGDQVVCLSHNQAARSGPRKEARGGANTAHGGCALFDGTRD